MRTHFLSPMKRSQEIVAYGHEAPGYEDELVRVHKQDDLFKMHTYRDGTLGTRGAFVLFPGDGVGGKPRNPAPNFFVRHPSALGAVSNHKVPSVGDFPLSPGGDNEQAHALRELLRQVLEMVSKRDFICRGRRLVRGS